MTAKRPPGFHNQVTASLSTKKKKLYCHFKSAWIGQQFTVTVGGAQKVVSCGLLSGVNSADNARCKTLFKSMHKARHNLTS